MGSRSGTGGSPAATEERFAASLTPNPLDATADGVAEATFAAAVAAAAPLSPAAGSNPN